MFSQTLPEALNQLRIDESASHILDLDFDCQIAEKRRFQRQPPNVLHVFLGVKPPNPL
jgi:hypothetical protein